MTGLTVPTTLFRRVDPQHLLNSDVQSVGAVAPLFLTAPRPLNTNYCDNSLDSATAPSASKRHHVQSPTQTLGRWPQAEKALQLKHTWTHGSCKQGLLCTRATWHIQLKTGDDTYKQWQQK